MRSQAPKALKLRQNLYRDLVENSMVGMYRTNLKGDIEEGADYFFDKSTEFDEISKVLNHLAQYNSPPTK